MNEMAPRNPYAPPQSRVDDVADDSGVMELGGRGARLGASLIDGVLMLAIVMPVVFGFGLGSEEEGFGADLRNGFLGSALGFGVFLALNGYLMARYGQTVGKKLVGLRMVRADGTRASFGRLLGLRYGVGMAIGSLPIAGPIYALLDSLLIFRASHQCLHDNIADTIVIKA
jgi:uncharacterized RDD family membrane protein YckC